MPQRPNFDITAESLVPLMDTIGILEIGEEEKLPILGAYFDQDAEFSGIYVISASSGVIYFDLPLDEVDTIGLTGFLIFISEGTEHVLRKLQTADGQWMSPYKTELPIEVLYRKVISSSSDTIEELVDIELPEDLPEFESIYVYYDETTLSVISLVYMSSYGIYAKANANWVPEDISVPSYQHLSTVEIDPDKADELIQLFDEKFGNVSLAQVKAYSSQVENEGEQVEQQ
jgi:hypothetical protein